MPSSLSHRCLLRLAFALAAVGLCVPAAHPRPLPPGEGVRVSGCVLHGEHFGPVEATVTVQMPDRGKTLQVRSGRDGRFAVVAPRHTRLVLTMTPLAPVVDATSQTLDITTGRMDMATQGCLVVW